MAAEQQPPNPELPTLVIQLKQDGDVEMYGPLDSPALCYGMLEQARDLLLYRKLEKVFGLKRGGQEDEDEPPIKVVGADEMPKGGP